MTDQTVTGNLTVAGTTISDGTITCRGSLVVGDFARLGSAAVTGLATVHQNLQINGATTVEAITVGGDSTVALAATAATTLAVTGNSTFSKGLTIEGGLIANAGGSHGTTTINGNLTVRDATTCQQALTIGGTANFLGTLDMNANEITNLGTPTVAADIANLGYATSVIASRVNLGRFVQQQTTTIIEGFYNSQSATIPINNRPTTSSGAAGPTVKITPTATANTLIVEFYGFVSVGGGSEWATVTLNSDQHDAVNSLAVNTNFVDFADASDATTLLWTGDAGGTQEQSFTVRYGHNAPNIRNASLCRRNPAQGSILPGTVKGYLRVTEYTKP